MAILEGKKAIIIGDRDGIPGPAIAECVKTLNERRRNGLRESEKSKGFR